MEESMLNRLDLGENAPWRQRFRAHNVLWAQIANLNPQRGLVCTDRDGVYQLYAWDLETGDLQQRTDQPAGVVLGTLSADGEQIYYHQDEGGNEIGHYVCIPFFGGLAMDVTPDLPPYGSFEIMQSFRGNMLGTRTAGPDGFSLYVWTPGEVPRLIHQSQNLFFGPSLSHDGEIAVIATTEGTGSLDTRLVALDVFCGEQRAELWEGEGVSHNLGEFSPLPGDFRMLSTTSRSGYPRPIIWNPLTGEFRGLALPGIPGEVVPLRWSRDAKRVLLSQLHQARRQLFLYDLEIDTATQLQHPAGLVGSYRDSGVMTPEGEILITWQDLAHPARVIALDGRSGRKLRTVLPAGDVPAGRSWRSVTFNSENGAAIHGWLAVPEGEGPFPTILHTHGGPTTVMIEYYFPESQAWLDHGFAFFSINFHGSTTFGKEFEKSIMGQLGELEVQDMAAAYRWLVENRIARPDAVLLTGDSYGGYLTLLALGRRPALWAGGMAGIAIADWALLYEDESDALRGYQRVLFGGTPEEKPEAHARSSPMTYAEDIQAPVLVIQGSNDTRCPARQMRVYEDRLRRLGKQIHVHWYEAGHGARAQEQQVEHQELKLRFARQVLG
jgi:acetyl esterase/lipase